MTIRTACTSFCLLLLCFFLPATSGAQTIHTCTVMPDITQAPAQQPDNLPGIVQKAVSYKPVGTYSNSWSIGGTITVKFLGGSSALQSRVMTYANEWTRYANVNFRVVSSGSADIRIGFTQNGSSWSMVGSGSARVDQQQATMNFGWLNDRTAESEVKRTVLHEFGHALGLLHEHQNPAGGIPWDEEAVYNHYWATQGWDRSTTYSNVIATANRNTTQYSAHDRASIMHYPVDSRLTNGRYDVGMNSELSAIDKQYIAKMYPGRSVVASTPTAPSRPTVVPAPSRPTVTPAPSRPTVVTTPAPSARGYAVQINNSLGKNQKAETVTLNVAGKQYTIRLDKNGRSQDQLNLQLPRGRHPYRIATSSTYFGYRNVRDRRGNISREYAETEIPGSGSGYLMIDGNASLTLYGSYDEAGRRMKVYLGVSK